MKKCFLVLSTLLMSVIPACAVDWQVVETTIPNFNLYIDMDSVKPIKDKEYVYAIKYNFTGKPEKVAYIKSDFYENYIGIIQAGDFETDSYRPMAVLDNPHVFDQVNQFTDFILVDDCSKYLNVSLFYDLVSGGMTVNPKNNRSFYIDFMDSPKFGFTTNYVPSEFDPSTNDRLLFMVFSDYYHAKTMLNDYLESRSIRDDFNKNLMTDYNETEWNNDINFFAQCLVFYLKMVDKGIKIQPPLDNILKRKYKSDMGANFEDWAYQYFSEDSEHLDCCIVREEALEDFKRFANMPRCTMQRFTKALNGFANLCPYVSSINPPDLLNSSGRLMKKVEGKTKEMIYVRTVKMAQKIAASEAMVTASEDGTTGLPFVPVESNPDEPF